MKKLIIILIAAAFIASSYGLIMKTQTKTTIGQTVTIEDFIGKWSEEFFSDEDEMLNSSFELYLEKDSTKKNALKGWHCSIRRGGRRIDCVDAEYGEEPSLHGDLKNDTVYLHFVSSFGGEGEAKLYFDKSAQNLSNIIWKVGKYKTEHYFPLEETLQKVNKEIQK